MKILFVCTGNTCRSPMAEFLMKNYIKENNIKNITDVQSRGLYVPENSPMSLNSLKALEYFDIEADDFYSRQLTEADLENFDKIYTMTNSHRVTILSAYPQYEDKVFTLSKNDISDPYLSEPEVYRITAEQILKGIGETFGENN